MSTFKVTIERLTVTPHPNADRLELAQVGLYRAVVPKGEYETGDCAIYIPEAAILPGDLIEELGLTGKLAGKEKNRVKAVRLRGELSQGIVCRPAKVPDWEYDPIELMVISGIDFAPELGITKWVPEIPTHMSGKVIPAPDLIRWVDIENLKRYPDIFSPGETVTASEKVHDSACLTTYHVDSDTLYVTSKGYGEKNLALEEDGANIYWRAVEKFELKKNLQLMAVGLDAVSVAIFGGVYGQGVQDLHYGKSARHNDTLGYVAFDVAWVSRVTGKTWMNPTDFAQVMTGFHIPTAPILYEGPFDLEKLTKVASGPTVLGNGVHIREGIVIRPQEEGHSDILGGRKIAKLVSDEYVLRKDGTEFE